MKPRWRSYAKPKPAPRRAGPLACNERVGVHFFLASARAKRMAGGASVRTPHQKIDVAVCQRPSHTHTRAAFVPKHRRSHLFEAPLPWCAVRSHNSDPTSSGQTVVTVDQSCGELFSIARLVRARESVRYATASLREDRTSVQGPRAENPGRGLERSTDCPDFGFVRWHLLFYLPPFYPPSFDGSVLTRLFFM